MSVSIYGFKQTIQSDGRILNVVDWPKKPKEGDEFLYIDPIGGASYNFFKFTKGKWKFLRNE